MLIENSMTILSKISTLGMRKCRQPIIVQAGHIADLWLVMLFEKSMTRATHAKAFQTRAGSTGLTALLSQATYTGL